MKIGYLSVLTGPFRGHKVKFYRSMTLGRDKKNSLWVPDPKVSRSHCRIDSTRNGFQIRDLKSGNGTFVNGRRIEKKILLNGDRITVGPTDLEYTESFVLIEDNEFQSFPVSREQQEFKTKLDEMSSTEIQRRFQGILKINSAVGKELELNRALEGVLEEVFKLMPADRGAILSINESSGKLEIICSRVRRGFTSNNDLLLSRTVLDTVLQDSAGLLIDDFAADSRFALRESICFDDIRSALCVPLLQHNEAIGVIYLDVLGKINAFTKKDLDLLMAIAGPASVQVQNALYVTKLKKSYWDTIQALANAVDARDQYTVGHNWRVSRLASMVGPYLGWKENKVDAVRLAGILHDIGKIGISDNILMKSSQLTPKEKQAMHQHPEIGARMIMEIDFLRPVIPSILYHHERWDGQGYPYRIKKEEIPPEGRLLAVCDAFDAMVTCRPYQGALPMIKALSELQKGAKSQFDPECVEAFKRAWKAGIISKAITELEIEAKDGPVHSIELLSVFGMANQS